jgi:hypothetical protein
MSDITRLPTKYGQGHADAIGYVQDVLLPALKPRTNRRQGALNLIGATITASKSLET